MSGKLRPTMFALTMIAAVGSTQVQVDAASVSVPLTRLPGLAGPSNSGTAIFRGDLGAIAAPEIFSARITDSNSGRGGSGGEFSGFDLDAIRISDTLATSATDASAASGLPVFDFTPAGTTFTPGSQRPPTESKLFGTDATGDQVDPTAATLDAFDGIFFTSGSVSLGDGGSVKFDFSNPVSTAGKYIYIGELSGDPGENIAGSLEVATTPGGNPGTPTVPTPGAALAGCLMLGGLALRRTRNCGGA